MASQAKHLGDNLSVRPLVFCPNASPLQLHICVFINLVKT